MSHFTLKLCETPHAITIDIMDEANSIKHRKQRNAKSYLDLEWCKR
jgi:hypothetical protein